MHPHARKRLCVLFIEEAEVREEPRQGPAKLLDMSALPYGSIRQHTSAYVSIRTPQPCTLDTSALPYVSANSRPYARQALKEAVFEVLKRRLPGRPMRIELLEMPVILIRMEVPIYAYVSIRQHTSACQSYCSGWKYQRYEAITS